MDLPPTTRHCCEGCYAEARRELPSETEGEVHGTTLPSPSVNSRDYWKQEYRDKCMQLEASQNREAALRKENARLTGLTADIPIAGGHRGGTSRWSIWRRVERALGVYFLQDDGTLDSNFMEAFLRSPRIRDYVGKGKVGLEEALEAKMGGRLMDNQYELLEEGLGVLPSFTEVIKARDKVEASEIPELYFACAGAPGVCMDAVEVAYSPLPYPTLPYPTPP